MERFIEALSAEDAETVRRAMKDPYSELTHEDMDAAETVIDAEIERRQRERRSDPGDP